jgi:hypothetical protein
VYKEMGREQLHIPPRRKYPRRKVKGEIPLKVLPSELDRAESGQSKGLLPKVRRKGFFETRSTSYSYWL